MATTLGDSGVSGKLIGRATARPTALRRALLAIAIAVGLPALARGDFVVRIEDKASASADTAFVDVFISSDNPNGDLLASFGFEFLISPTGPRRLEFVSPPSDSQLTQPNYVF